MSEFFSPVVINERAYFILLNSESVGIAVVDENGYYVYANNEYCDMLEYSEAELYKKRFQDVTHPEDIGWASEESNKLVKGQKKGYGPVSKKYVTKSGQIALVKIRVDSIYSENGKFLYFLKQVSRLQPAHCDNSVDKSGKVDRKWLEFLRENWLIIVLMVSTLAATVNNIFSDREKQAANQQAEQKIEKLEHALEQVTIERSK